MNPSNNNINNNSGGGPHDYHVQSNKRGVIMEK